MRGVATCGLGHIRAGRGCGHSYWGVVVGRVTLRGVAMCGGRGQGVRSSGKGWARDKGYGPHTAISAMDEGFFHLSQ